MAILTALEMAVDAYGDRLALTIGGQSLGYAALPAAARHAGMKVRRRGISHPGHLSVSGPAAAIGLCAGAGVPHVPLNYRQVRLRLSALRTGRIQR